MEQKALFFGEDCINKNIFHKNKRPINTGEVNIKRIMLSSKHSYDNKGSFKCFFSNTIIHETSSNEWIY